jgi:hypothetical protein
VLLMARIRSIHPAIFTDEVFVSLSESSQLLWIGLWCEADDQGVFEWKPLSLRMRLRPVSGKPIDEQLDELCETRCLARFEVEGRPYGVIRNFVKHQRPKSPKVVHPLPDELRAYAGFRPDGSRPHATTGRKRFDNPEGSSPCHSEAVRNEFGTGSGNRSQMKDVGCSSVPKGTGASAPPEPSAIPSSPDWRSLLFRDGLSIVVGLTGKTEAGTRPMIGRWLKVSRDDCRQVLRIIEDAREANPADPVAWIEAALRGPRKPPTNSMAFVMARA